MGRPEKLVAADGEGIVTCACGLGESIETCCGPYLKGDAFPETAEALMRSRYTAFTVADVDYIIKTHDPDTADQVDRENTEEWARKSEWLGFELVSKDKGEAADDFGTIEFVAKYKLKGVTIDHRERATFRKHNGRWVFVDGEQVAGPPIKRDAPKVGRNDHCPCGSGKKYKKCCGKAA